MSLLLNRPIILIISAQGYAASALLLATSITSPIPLHMSVQNWPMAVNFEEKSYNCTLMAAAASL